MAERQLKKLQYDSKDVVAEVAIRDGEGNIIASTYAKTSDIPTDTSELTNGAGFLTSNDLPIASISVNDAQVQPVNKNVNINTNIYPVGNTNYRIQFQVVNGQPQLVYEEVS